MVVLRCGALFTGNVGDAWFAWGLWVGYVGLRLNDVLVLGLNGVLLYVGEARPPFVWWPM